MNSIGSRDYSRDRPRIKEYWRHYKGKTVQIVGIDFVINELSEGDTFQSFVDNTIADSDIPNESNIVVYICEGEHRARSLDEFMGKAPAGEKRFVKL